MAQHFEEGIYLNAAFMTTVGRDHINLGEAVNSSIMSTYSRLRQDILKDICLTLNLDDSDVYHLLKKETDYDLEVFRGGVSFNQLIFDDSYGEILLNFSSITNNCDYKRTTTLRHAKKATDVRSHLIHCICESEEYTDILKHICKLQEHEYSYYLRENILKTDDGYLSYHHAVVAKEHTWGDKRILHNQIQEDTELVKALIKCGVITNISMENIINNITEYKEPCDGDMANINYAHRKYIKVHFGEIPEWNSAYIKNVVTSTLVPDRLLLEEGKTTTLLEIPSKLRNTMEYQGKFLPEGTNHGVKGEFGTYGALLSWRLIGEAPDYLFRTNGLPRDILTNVHVTDKEGMWWISNEITKDDISPSFLEDLSEIINIKHVVFKEPDPEFKEFFGGTEEHYGREEARRVGIVGEKLATELFRQAGYDVQLYGVEKNGGEPYDIILNDNIYIEVKTRKTGFRRGIELSNNQQKFFTDTVFKGGEVWIACVLLATEKMIVFKHRDIVRKVMQDFKVGGVLFGQSDKFTSNTKLVDQEISSIDASARDFV